MKYFAKLFKKETAKRSLRVRLWIIPIPFTRCGIALIRNGYKE